MKNLFKFTLAGLIGLFMVIGLQAQNEHPTSKEHPSAKTKAPASPAKEATGKIGSATVTINYSSPSVKGRTIWGELVPFNEVWRAGANAATTIKTTKNLLVEGKELPAGTYSFFIIPRENGPATVIFNKTIEQWGGFDYDESKDALRIDLSPEENKMTEQLEYQVNNDGIVVAWDQAKLRIKVKAK